MATGKTGVFIIYFFRGPEAPSGLKLQTNLNLKPTLQNQHHKNMLARIARTVSTRSKAGTSQCIASSFHTTTTALDEEDAHDLELDNRPLYELRTYQLKPEHFMDYIALTSSDAFKARTEASKLNFFAMVEMGDVVNSVVHLWEYDDLDHRTAVRASLAGDVGFGEYITTIRPWLVSQESFLTRGEIDQELVEGKASGSGKYMLQAFQGDEYLSEENFFEDDDEVENVGLFNTCIGDNTISYRLLRAETFQQLLEASEDSGVYHNSQLLIPTTFSPAQ